MPPYHAVNVTQNEERQGGLLEAKQRTDKQADVAPGLSLTKVIVNLMGPAMELEVDII